MVPQHVYEAAQRVVFKDERPGDAAILREWESTDRTTWDMALSVLDRATKEGYARVCVL